MNILDRFHVEKTGNYRLDEINKSPVLSMECEKTAIGRCDNPMLDEYKIELRVGVVFWCTEAERKLAKKAAERVLLDRLYADSLTLVHEAQAAVYAGDRAYALKLLDKIRDSMVGRD